MIGTEPGLSRRAANFVPLTPVDFLRRSVEIAPDKTAVVAGTITFTYAEFAALVGRIAAGLRRSGVGRGDVVSILAVNRPEMLALHYAVPMLGAVLNTINVRLDVATVGYILSHSECDVVFSDGELAGLAQAAVTAAARPIKTVLLDAPPEPENEGIALDAFLDGIEPDPISLAAIADEWQPVCLNYTSGTTGHPKGVVYHHRGAFLNSLGNVLALGFDVATSYLWVLPMFHCNGWTHTWAVTAVGGTHICLPRPDPGEILGALDTHDVTHFCCAPVILYMLLNHPQAPLTRPKRRIRVATGGAAPTTALIEGMERLGIEIVHLYGLTESYGPATLCRVDADADLAPADKARFLARQGIRHPLAAEVSVRAEDGRDAASDSETLGEITIRSNTLMAGYYKDEAATEKAFAGGVFHTGDLAVRHPDGYVEIKDRAKDIIISGGENISSLEVENVLHQHPAILLAAVVAVPDPKWGEVPCACIELKPDAPPPQPDDIIAFCRERLARYKVPRRVVFRALPKTATGKIQKFALRSELSAASD